MGVSVPRVKGEDEKIPVWPENWPSLLAFLDLDTQWRSLVTPGRLLWQGLDYGAVKILLDAEGHGREVFADIRTMEGAALEVLNEGE